MSQSISSGGPRVNPSAFSDVVGMANDAGRIGVIGSNPDNNAFGFLAGNDLVFDQHAGVYGESDQQGVMGLTTVPGGTGVYGGGTTSASGRQIGVRGETNTGVGVLGRSFGDGPGVRGESVTNGVEGQTNSGNAGVFGQNGGIGLG